MNPKDFLSKMQDNVFFDKTQQGVFKMRLIKPALMLNSDSTGYWTQSLLVNTTKCMSLFSVNQAFCKSFFYRPISSYYFGINEPSKYLLMSRPPKAGIFFVLNLIETLNFSTKLQKMYHLANKSCGERLLPWKTEFLCILICIKKSFNSSVFLMYFRHLLTFPLSPFLIDSRKKREGEIQKGTSTKFVL